MHTLGVEVLEELVERLLALRLVRPRRRLCLRRDLVPVALHPPRLSCSRCTPVSSKSVKQTGRRHEHRRGRASRAVALQRQPADRRRFLELDLNLALQHGYRAALGHNLVPQIQLQAATRA